MGQSILRLDNALPQDQLGGFPLAAALFWTEDVGTSFDHL